MNRKKRENLIDCLFGVVCAVLMVLFGLGVLCWLRNGGAVWLGI